MNFFKRNARFIVPAMWLILAAMKLWEALHSGQVVHYVMSFAFVGVALLFYLGQRQIYLKQQATDPLNTKV